MNKVIHLLFSGFIFFILITQISCDSMKNDPEYVGTWQASETINTDGIIYTNTRTIILTRSTYEETYIIRRENSPSISAIVGTGGTLGRSHSNLIFKIEKLGTCILDELDACTGEVEWHGRGSSYYNANIIFFEQTYTGEFSVTGSSLKLVRDLNNDGDTIDTGEDILFELI